MANKRDPHGEAVAEYEAAEERLGFVVEAWEEAGRPLLDTGSTGQLVVHPLWKMIQDGEAHAAKLRREVARRHRGPEPKAVVTAKVGESPAAKLRKSRKLRAVQ